MRNGTLPPGFYTSNLATRIVYLWLQLDWDQVETLLSWKPGVHKLHTVNIPRNVEYTLSLNLKYLFPALRKPEVAYAWFEELTRKVGWSTYFMLQGQDDSDWDQLRNDPLRSWQMGLPYPKSKEPHPDIGDYWFNEGIRAGREFMSRSLISGRSVPQPEGSRDVLRRITLSPKRLHQYLSEASLLAFTSDKNLGIVVVTRDWYATEVKKFLDAPVFRRFSGNFGEFRQEVLTALTSLQRGHHPSGPILPFLSGRKMERFWNECWTKTDIPRFYGIPKIHKNPWKLRPIVPMHSYVTSQVAIILHHMLLPVQRSFSWICESSRTLASEVAEYNKSLFTSTRLHTGDVTAMYTSITWESFRIALAAILEEGDWYDEGTRSWILNAADILWNHTVFQFGPGLIRQIDGIPMGIHCGPVFANLFMARYEKYWLSQLPDDFFYRRYIDDCFAIHPSDALVCSIPLPDLTIQWEHSGSGLSFLDVFFHTHPGQPGICFRPFEKTGNHHQYLPWASNHPLSVKKGMIKGELSRVRAICYKLPYFTTWKRQFLSRLSLRGWPPRVLQSWSRQVQWRNFFPSAGLAARKTGSRIIAVSEYNPVWDTLSSTDIWQTMRTTWARRQPPLTYPSNCLIAKKRTKSLWDVVRSVNRNLLHEELEERINEELSSVMSSLDVSMPYSPY
jgi:hypothetical protein